MLALLKGGWQTLFWNSLFLGLLKPYSTLTFQFLRGAMLHFSVGIFRVLFSLLGMSDPFFYSWWISPHPLARILLRITSSKKPFVIYSLGELPFFWICTASCVLVLANFLFVCVSHETILWRQGLFFNNVWFNKRLKWMKDMETIASFCP